MKSMMYFNPLKKAFKELEKTLIRNVANSLIQLTFHEAATEEELEQYYGGKVDREAMVEDTRKRIASEQMILQFYKNNKHEIIKQYGTKNPTGDLGLNTQQATGLSADVGSEDQGAQEDGPEQGNKNGGGLSEDGSGKANGGLLPKGGTSQIRGGEDGTGRDRGNDEGGIEARDLVSDEDIDNFPDETEEPKYYEKK